jgi:AcrR family transcriptional regulator
MTEATLTAPEGLRARNKMDKLRRIKNAAQSFFVAKGFDDTTMREIAVRAGVGLGTIFLYAKDKRDLLFLTINEPLEQITGEAEAAVEPKARLIDNLLAVARLHYRFFGQQPALARLALREMIFYETGAQAASFQRTRDRLIRLFGRAIELAAANGEITPIEAPQFAGWTVFCIFQVELRRWFANDVTEVRSGLSELERALRLLIAGLGAEQQALAGGSQARKKVNRQKPTRTSK